MAWTHIAFALFFYVLALKITYLTFSLPTAALLCLATLLPDIDSSSSWIGKRTFRAFFFSHRGFWHSLFGLALFVLFLTIITWWLNVPSTYLTVFAAGYFLHLAADSLNPLGVKWFWKAGHLRGPIRTASLFEHLLFIALLLGMLYLLLS